VTDTQLPGSFSDLEPLVARWALSNQAARLEHLARIDIPELKQFHDTMLPRMDAIIAHLNSYDITDLPDPQQRLFHLAMTFAETAHPIDLRWKKTQIDGPFPAERLKLVGVSREW